MYEWAAEEPNTDIKKLPSVVPLLGSLSQCLSVEPKTR